MIVADTDALIDFLSGAEPGAGLVAGYLKGGDLWITVINRFELLAGIQSRKQEKIIQQLLRALPTLPLDEQSADSAAAVRSDLISKGADIGMADCLIAGIVLEQGASLLTRNKQHFSRVEGISLV